MARQKFTTFSSPTPTTQKYATHLVMTGTKTSASTCRRTLPEMSSSASSSSARLSSSGEWSAPLLSSPPDPPLPALAAAVEDLTYRNGGQARATPTSRRAGTYVDLPALRVSPIPQKTRERKHREITADPSNKATVFAVTFFRQHVPRLFMYIHAYIKLPFREARRSSPR